MPVNTLLMDYLRLMMNKDQDALIHMTRKKSKRQLITIIPQFSMSEQNKQTA